MIARAFLLIVLSLGIAFEAEANGIYGTVQDAVANTFLAGVQVDAVNNATGVSTTTSTNGDGYYIIDPLDVGQYTVSFSLPGYQTLTVQDVAIFDSFLTTLYVSLNPQATMLTTKSVTPGTTVLAGTPVTITVTETNVSNSTIFSVSVSGTGCTSWTGGSSTLAAGTSTDFSCTFTPSATSAWTATGFGTDSLGNPVPTTGETASGTIAVTTTIHPSTTLTTKSIIPGTTVPAGTPVTITVTETNTGDSPIAAISVTGNGCTSWTGGSSTLAAGASTDFSCTFAPTVATGWSATGHGTDSFGNPVPATGETTSGTITVTAIHPSTTLTTKSVTPGTTVPAGTPITIKVTETNTGDSPISAISVSGTGCTSWAGGSATLAAGGSTDFSCTFAPTAAASWSATGHGTDSLGNPVPSTGETTSGTITVTAIHPSTTLTTKSVNPGTTVPAGTPVTITVTETNTGDSPISAISVSGTGCTSWTGGSATLAAGAATNFSCTFAPTAAAGWSATGHGTDSLGNPVPSTGETTSGTITVTAIHPSTTLTTKSVNPGTTVPAGTPVTITVTETNSGDSPISAISVSGTGCTSWTGGSATLAAGGSTDFSCTFAPTAATSWSATGHGTDSLGNPVPSTGETTSGTITVTAIHPSTTLTTKSVTPGTTVPAGTPVTIRVTETNTGDSPISAITVSGTGCTSWAGGSATLAAGASTDFSCTFAPTAAASWSATGHGTDSVGNPVPTTGETTSGTITVTAIHPSTTLTTKSVTPGTTVPAGTPITITVTETNSGDSPISAISVSGTGCTAWTGGSATLAAGASTDFSCTFAPIAAASWSATGHGTDSLGNAVPTAGETTSGTITVTAIHPSTTLTTKSVTPGTTVPAGTPITITVTETNSGDSPISAISVSGTGCTAWTGGSATLAAGGSTDFSCTFAPIAAASWSATGHGTDSLGNAVPTAGETTSGTITVTAIHPSTTLTTKSVTPGTTVPAGTPITITVTETNTGDAPISAITVSGTGCTSWAGGSATLLAGASTDFSCTFAPIAAASWSATGHGTDSLGNPVPTTGETTSGTITVTAIHPSMTLTTKSVTPGTTVPAGTPVTITVTERNTGDSPISAVSVTGTGCISWTGGSSTLLAGASTDFSCTFTPAPSGITAWTATGHGTDALGNSVPATTGGTTSGTLTTTSNPGPPNPNPGPSGQTPAISTLSPDTRVAGGPAFVLTVTGNNFGVDAAVQWTGQPLATTFVTAAELRADVPVSLIALQGTASITVTSGGSSSTSVTFTIAPPPTISSVIPNTVTAGGPTFILTINGTGFTNEASVLWNGISLDSTLTNPTLMTATVPARLIATVTQANITVSIQGVSSNSRQVSVLPPSITITPTLTSLSPTSVFAGGPPLVLTVNGNGFVSSSTVFWNQAKLDTNFVDSQHLTASVPAALISSPASVQITVTSGGSTSDPLPFTISPLPHITFTGLQPTPFPTQETSVGVQLESPFNDLLEGTLTITFRPVAGIPAGYMDPFLQFASGGTTLNFVIQPGTTSAVLSQNGVIQQGTVAGDIVVTLTRLVAGSTSVLSQPAPSGTVTVPRLVPVITPNSVRIINVTSNSLDVETTLYSTTLELITATYTFGIASGVQVLGSAVVPVDLRSPAAQWYASSQFGSMVRVQVRFPIDGDPNQVQGVTVTLTNTAGTSVAVTGGK